MIEQKDERTKIKGISVSNPVDVDKDYLMFTVDYAAKNGFNHIQFIGPIHNAVKGNIDGMTLYRKYSQFNETKDLSYVMKALDAVHAACKRAKKHGIRTYVWHHELELPLNFKEIYPEVKNSCGDIEITHPLVKDFLENKIKDFFHAYPDIDGIVLTLHETSVPLLKLKNQKLGKIERVKYVTEILYKACQTFGRELIVRPFASIEEDYVMMAKAYEEVSSEMLIMDKWTQFDWSLSLPNNAFYSKIEKNPLLVEADVFGEFFGKGHFPLMLKDHLAEKFAYCEGFAPRGYVARIDRGGEVPFGSVNEVNEVITAAHLNQKDVEAEIDTFFETRYPGAGADVRRLMEPTEEILRRTIYTKGYYFSELSFFPTLNHSKNHFYFEMMRENYAIASNEWFIPKDWNRGTLADVLREKESAAEEAGRLYEELQKLQGRIAKKEFEKLQTKFLNLKLVTEIWLILTRIYMDYVKYFETKDERYKAAFDEDIEMILERNHRGINLLGKAFYCLNSEWHEGHVSNIENFVKEVRQSFELEKAATEAMEQEKNVLDYVICGGALEGHKLQKEVNFSDTLVQNGALCRIPGSLRGMKWCSINAHGWFSYEVAVTPFAENHIEIKMGSSGEELDVCVTINGGENNIHDKADGAKVYRFRYAEKEGNTVARIRFDKTSSYTPMVFWIKVLEG